MKCTVEVGGLGEGKMSSQICWIDSDCSPTAGSPQPGSVSPCGQIKSEGFSDLQLCCSSAAAPPSSSSSPSSAIWSW